MNNKDYILVSKSLLYFIIPTFVAIIFCIISTISISFDGQKLKDVIVTCSQIFSCVFVGWGVFYTALMNKKNNDDNKIREDKFHDMANQKDIDKRSFEMISRWDSEVLLKARNFSRRHVNTNPYKLAKLIKRNPNLEESVIILLNFADNIRVALKRENVLLNRDIIKTLAPALLSILERFEIYYMNNSKDDEAINDYQETKNLMREMKLMK